MGRARRLRLGARRLVAPFADPIGRDAIVRWPGGASMQFYWCNSPPTAPPLVTIPEQRVYISTERADSFVTSFLRFSKGEVISDDGEATVLVEPFESEGREAAMVQFPGGYIAEIHTVLPP